MQGKSFFNLVTVPQHRLRHLGRVPGAGWKMHAPCSISEVLGYHAQVNSVAVPCHSCSLSELPLFVRPALL